MLEFAYLLHVASHVDSVIPSTREFWRRKIGMPEDVVADPRALAVILAERRDTCGNNVDDAT
ncbi:hypothetical protein J2X76_003620 [Neorhizobium sp. 2083]|uniref:hypothetical protein n=1 Tax=Neorhizobium sp. 2083 TaxID=2817762 RepID=UPI00285F9257|nr:hypothetical protein [Neorhizobium sp. 2083]MDR6818443.1 hypothetical protein [Neorhizobium sp. 2083]